MNGLYLVCDGGGTKTDFLLFEKTGRVRGRAQGAGANANFVPPAEAAHTVYAGVMECLAQLHDTHVTGTLLEKNVLEMLGLPDVLSIRDAAYRPDFTRRHVARLSYAVERSAREGDANACAVLDEAACALARLAATVAGQLDADGLPVALTGGVARMGELFTGRFRRALEHLVPQCVYQPAKYSPVVGAALCVLSESAGVDITAPGVAENLMKEKMGEAHVDG